MVDDQSPVAPAITRNAADDLDFIRLVHRAVSAELGALAVYDLFLIRVDNWFDHKWRNFSGKGRVGFGHHTGLVYNPDTALDAIHREGTKSTFSPSRPIGLSPRIVIAGVRRDRICPIKIRRVFTQP